MGVMMSKDTLRQKGGSIDAIAIIRALNCCDIELSGRCKIIGDLVSTALIIKSKITIENCIFLGVVDFTKSIFYQEICFSGTHFSKEVRFLDTEFRGRAHFDDTIFYNMVDFDFASFKKDVSFHLARFPAYGTNQIVGFNNTNFYGEAAFSHLTFENSYHITHIENAYALIDRLRNAPDFIKPWWWRCHLKKDPVSSFIKGNITDEDKLTEAELISALNRLIEGPSLFKEPCFRNIATEKTKEKIQINPERMKYHNRLLLANAYPKFIDNIIVNEIRFMGAKFRDRTNFSGSRFIKADFRDAMFHDKTMFCFCKFVENADFKGATFDRNCLFYGCTFCGEANFSGAIFDKAVNWGKSKFIQNLSLNGAKICSMQFEETEFNKIHSIKLRGSQFNLLVIPWEIIKNHLFVEPEMDAIYLSFIKSYKDLGWWSDADDCSFNYNLYKNRSQLVNILENKNLDSILNMIRVPKLEQPRLTDLATWLCGYGIKIKYLIMPSFILVFISGLFFYLANHQSESIFVSFGNSTLLFFTGNLGNLSQPYSYVAAFESLFRAMLFGVFIVILTRKLFR